MNFHQSFKKVEHSHSRHQKATTNLLRIDLKGKLSFNNSWQLEGANLHNSMVNFRGHPKNVCFMQFSQNIDGFGQNDSKGF